MNKKLIAAGFLLPAVAALALRLVFFSISIQHVPVTSDESAEFLMAEDIAGGRPHLLFLAQPYQFPVISYLTAPFVRWLPRTEFGARLIPFLFGLLDVVLLLLILRQALRTTDAGGDRRERRAGWCFALWILFPSAYLLMQQSAYRITGYTALTACSLLAILAALHGRRRRWACACGLAGGLAFSSSMLALPVTLAAGVYAVLAGAGRRLPGRLAAWLAGLGLGLLPFLLAKWLIPGAHQAVADHAGWAEIRQRLTGGAFRQAMLSALGIEPNVFPDETPLHFIPQLDPAAFYLWLAICAGLLLLRAGRLLAGLLRRRRLELAPWDLFLAIALIAVAAAVSSARFDSRSTRYLLPAVWCFPLIGAGLAAALAAGRAWPARLARGALALALAALVGYNLYASLRLMRAWQAPDFAVRHVSTPDLRPAIAFLQDQGIRHGIAAYWVAYRINFLTARQILCSQSVNERFPDWPVPYKDTVDASTNVAYILTGHTRFLTPQKFEEHLQIMDVACRRSEAGDCVIYHAFQDGAAYGKARRLPAELIQATASHGQADLHKLTDGNYQSRWTTRAGQQTGMWVQVELPGFHLVNRLTLHYGRYHQDHAGGLKLLARTPAGWQVAATNLPAAYDKFAMQNGHPVYGIEPRQTIIGPAVEADALRLEISDPRPDRNWTITQLEIGVLESEL